MRKSIYWQHSSYAVYSKTLLTLRITYTHYTLNYQVKSTEQYNKLCPKSCTKQGQTSCTCVRRERESGNMRCTRGSKLILSLYPSLEKEDQEGPFLSRVLLARSEDTREKTSSLGRCCLLVRRKGREEEFQTCLPLPPLIKFPAADSIEKAKSRFFFLKKT